MGERHGKGFASGRDDGGINTGKESFISLHDSIIDLHLDLSLGGYEGFEKSLYTTWTPKLSRKRKFRRPIDYPQRIIAHQIQSGIKVAEEKRGVEMVNDSKGI
jgi:hypothetical protein